jgi:hypothetical protein
MTEIKYELTNLDDTTRAMREKGTHESVSGYEEVWLGNHSGLDVWAGVDVGNYPTYDSRVGAYLKENYTAKEIKGYDNHLSVYNLSMFVNGSKKPEPFNLIWGLADVRLYFYVMNVEVADSYLYATKQEIGFCPEANLIDLGEPQAFGVLDVVQNIVKKDSLFDYAVNKALVEAKSLASDISRKLT